MGNLQLSHNKLMAGCTDFILLFSLMKVVTSQTWKNVCLQVFNLTL